MYRQRERPRGRDWRHFSQRSEQAKISLISPSSYEVDGHTSLGGCGVVDGTLQFRVVPKGLEVFHFLVSFFLGDEASVPVCGGKHCCCCGHFYC